jgi:hypothetical protein
VNCSILREEVIVCVQSELTNLNEAQSPIRLELGRKVQVKVPHSSISTRIFYTATLCEEYSCVVPNSPFTMLKFWLCLHINMLHRHLNLKEYLRQ